jgi:hypothetical protein
MAVGLAMEAVSPARQWRGLAIVTLGLGTLAVAVFWSGQIVDAILGGDPNWGRAAGRAVLQWCFVVAASASAAAMRRHDPPL